jgi:uncharacterized protein (DUF849 family)
LPAVLIKAAINGGRAKSEHAAVPTTPKEQAKAVVECLKAGANAIHLHVRFTGGLRSRPLVEKLQSENESLYAEDVAVTLLTVRAATPNAQIGVSTGAWILPDPNARQQAVAAWKVFPDFASVNFNEAGAVELARMLLSRGVSIEAGLCNADAAKVLVKSDLVTSCLRVLLEPQEQELERAIATVNAIEKVLNSEALGTARLPPLLLHGTEATVWPMMDEALARGYDIRIGLEDTLVLPDGKPALDNVELVTEAIRRGRTVGAAG